MPNPSWCCTGLFDAHAAAQGVVVAWKHMLWRAQHHHHHHRVDHHQVNKRTGWVRRGVEGAESIADHMYRMAVMAMLFAGTDIDYQRCVMMAIVHDMAEGMLCWGHAKVWNLIHRIQHTTMYTHSHCGGYYPSLWCVSRGEKAS